MKYRPLGSLSVSEVGIGCNNFGARLDLAGTTAVVDAALAAGINFFDTADVYGGTQSEVLLGQALGQRRGDVVVASKFGMPLSDTKFGARPEYIRQAVTDSLARLGTDYIDLYQLHYPDDRTPIADTIAALQELVAEGKIREFGCSNFSQDQLREAARIPGQGFVSIQNQYSLLFREPETNGVLDEVAATSMGFLPYYPLANGLLTGKFRPGQPIPEGSRLQGLATSNRAPAWFNERFDTKVSALLTYAEELGIPILTLAFSWLLAHGEVSSVIAGASNPTQVAANAAAVVGLEPAVMTRLNEITAETF
jgi:aryl-alcohol dehydrogenase-like predicted oxidoreductase